MLRDFRREAYELIVKASHDCKGEDIDSVFWDAAGLLGKELKAMHTRSRNFELMLIRIIRAVLNVKRDRDDWECQLEELTTKAAEMIARLDGEGQLR